jgi:hypothetical protein
MFKDDNLECSETFMRATDNYRQTACQPLQAAAGNLNPTSVSGQKGVVLCSRVEEEEYLKKAAKDARIERIKQVREQEKYISRHGKGKQYREELKKESQEEQQYLQYLEYLQQK